MQHNEHYIYMSLSRSWWDFDKNKSLTKIGSSNNPFARIKTLQTSVPYQVELIGYFKIHNYNCYKLDNIIKIQFKDLRAMLQGGTEFYYDVTYDQLNDLFNSLGIRFEWTKYNPDAEYPDVPDNEIILDQEYGMCIQDNEKQNLIDFNEINILLCPVPKNSNEMFMNFTNTILNGIDYDSLEQNHNIQKQNGDKIFVWGHNEKSLTEWKRMKIDDFMFILSSRDHTIVIFQIKQKINSKKLSKEIWDTDLFKYIYVLDKIQMIKQNISEFLIEHCKYKKTIKNIQGNLILNKNKQHESMTKLLNIMI